MPEFDYQGSVIVAGEGESVLEALLRAGNAIRHGCRTGACQSCVLRTSDPVSPAGRTGLDDALVELGAFLSCQTPAREVTRVEALDESVLPLAAAALIEKQWLAEDVLGVTLAAPGFVPQPGRFVRLVHPSGLSRPYSLAQPAWAPPFEVQFHVRVIPGGQMSDLLTNAPLGQAFGLQGPFGKCRYRSESCSEPILLIGSGTGLAPLYAIASDAVHQGHQGPIRLYHGAATSSRLYFRDELHALAGIEYVPCVGSDPGPNDRVGSPLTEALKDHPDLEGTKVYLCGHPDLVKRAQRMCFLAGASLRDIAADAFAASS